MLVLHANWVRRRLWLWGETALRHSAVPDGALNPFCLSRAYLGAVVDALCGGVRRRDLRVRHVRRVAARLPSYGGFPLPSRLYFMPSDWPAPPGDAPPAFCKTDILALPLSLAEASALLAKVAASADSAAPLARNASAGGDLVALARLWKLVGAIIARERVLPGVVGAESRWSPALDAEGLARVDAAVRAVPDSACCLEGASPPAVFFADAVDCQMRAAVSTALTRLHARKSVFYDLHSAFLASLRSFDPAIRWGDASEIAAFAAEMREWRRPVDDLSGGDVCLGFRIADPADPDAEDPKWTLLPVAVADGKVHPLSPGFLARQEPGVARRLLVALGQASVLAPELSADAPSGSASSGAVRLDASAIHTFLKEDSAALRAAGFPVFAPSWWSPARRGGDKPVVRAAAVRFKTGTGLFSLDSLLDVKWEVALGGDKLAAGDIEWMLRSESPVVRFAGRWVAVDAGELRAAKEKLERLLRNPVSLRELVQLGIGSGVQGGVEVKVDPDVIPEEAKAGNLISMLGGAAKLERVPVPRGFRGKLRPYQRRGLDWLSFLYGWGFGACLADDMGLGKTIEAVSLFLAARAKGMQEPVLVVCPMSIMLKWAREIAAFAPKLRTWIYHGHGRPRGVDFVREAQAHDVCVTSYQMLCSEYGAVKSVRWGIVALDEAQNIKNPRTAKSRAARSLGAGWRLALTGTPVENNVGDLWAIMDFLNPGLLLGQREFVERFQRPVVTGSDPRAQQELRRLTAPFILRRLKSDPEIVSDMPPKVEEKIYCGLTREQAELYAAEVRDIENGISSKTGIARHGAVLALLTRLKQICNHPAQYLYVDDGGAVPADPLAPSRSGKLTRLDEMLADVLAAGECALVFTQYAVMGGLLARHLSEKFGFDVPFLHGGVPMAKRDELVSRFQRPDGPPVFVLSIKAGGTGLDLTRANHVFHYDRWWNPAVENQATDRAHRIGQTKTVFVHTFICEGTLESHIDDLITGKLELARNLIADGDKWLSSLDDAGLRKVVELSSEFREDDLG